MRTASPRQAVSWRASVKAWRKSRSSGSFEAIICLKRPDFGLVLDVADGERADAERVAARERRAVHEQLHALDARRRDGVDVGDDEQVLGELPCAPCEITCTPAAAAAKITSAFSMISRFWSAVSPATASRSTPKRSLETAADLMTRSTPRWATSCTWAPSSAVMIEEAKPTTPVAPNTATLRALPAAAELELQDALDAGDHGGGGRERAGGIGEDRELEGRHHGLPGRFHHVEGEDRVLAADEDAGAHAVVGRTREDGVLHERRHLLERHVDVGDDDLVAGVGGHVHVERAHMLLRREHVQDWRCVTHSIFSLFGAHCRPVVRPAPFAHRCFARGRSSAQGPPL